MNVSIADKFAQKYNKQLIIKENMESAGWISYKHGWWEEKNVNWLNELSDSDLKSLINYAGVKDRKEEDEKKTFEFIELLIVKLGEKNFCKQVDFDHTFGNITWMRPYWYFADAEQVIKDQSEDNVGKPHYLLDDSEIFIYKFDELRNADNEEKLIIGYYLRIQLEEKLKCQR